MHTNAISMLRKYFCVTLFTAGFGSLVACQTLSRKLYSNAVTELVLMQKRYDNL